MQSEQQTLLQEQLNKVNQSLVFLVFVILSILLSFYGTIIQRQELVCFLLGKERPEWLPEVFPFRISASALVIGALGFFLCLALDTRREAERTCDPNACRSATINWVAAVLVFLAALFRLDDLLFTAQAQLPETDSDALPV